MAPPHPGPIAPQDLPRRLIGERVLLAGPELPGPKASGINQAMSAGTTKQGKITAFQSTL